MAYRFTRRHGVVGFIGAVAGMIVALPLLWAAGRIPWLFSWLTTPALALVLLTAAATHIDVISNGANPVASNILWTLSIGLVSGFYAVAGKILKDGWKESRKPSTDSAL